MKKIIFVLLLACMGCASVRIPTYLQDKNSSTKRFYATYDEAYQTVIQALDELGWRVEETMDPLIYEQDRIHDLDERQILITTEVRQTPLLVGTRYARMNIYLRSKKSISEIEIRYLTVTALPFKNLTTYNNNRAVDRIFQHIQRCLHPEQP